MSSEFLKYGRDSARPSMNSVCFTEARLDLFDRPKSMLHDERLIVARGRQESGQILSCPDVAERYADVAK